MGKRKKPPKLPQRAFGNTRLLYARVTQYQPDEVDAAVGTADVIILNWGLHYQRMADYRSDLEKAFSVLDKVPPPAAAHCRCRPLLSPRRLRRLAIA